MPLAIVSSGRSLLATSRPTNDDLPESATAAESSTVALPPSAGAASKAVVAPVGGWLAVDNGAFAFVVDSDGTHATRRPVKLGRRNPESVEILSGLNPGERIVTSNLSSVKGDAINIR